LRLSAEEMRSLGERAVDEVVTHLTTLRARPVGRLPDRDALEALLAGPPPAEGSALDEVVDEVVRVMSVGLGHTDHPRFLAYVPGPSNYVGAIADFLAAGFNVFAGQWLVGAGPAVMERVTVDWFRRLCGFPATGGGLFVSGGTMANLVAVHAARTTRGPGPVYLTAKTHRSIRRGLSFLGIPDDLVREVATDDHHRMSTADLERRLRADGSAASRSACVIATAGTTSTGAVDPLADLAGLCAREGAWLHVDGAYGAAAVLSPTTAPLLDGLALADSVALDPHKWWYQPYEVGCVLVRDESTLTDTFRLDAEYLTETRHGAAPLNYYDLGPQLTRGFRALKVWMSMKAFGLAAFREAVEHSVALAEHAQDVLTRRPGWEVVTPAQLAVITFRPSLPGTAPEEIDAIVRRAALGTLADGYAFVTTTEPDGRPALRFCTTHPETTTDDIERTIDLLAELVGTGAARPITPFQ
jgi:glutamate/tyrosine decarboxylase-like PLP-dependent enzyme